MQVPATAGTELGEAIVRQATAGTALGKATNRQTKTFWRISGYLQKKWQAMTSAGLRTF